MIKVTLQVKLYLNFSPWIFFFEYCRDLILIASATFLLTKIKDFYIISFWPFRKVKKWLVSLLLIFLFGGWGREGKGVYGVTKYRNTDDFFLKIIIYCNIFLKIPIPNSFTASQVFASISRQPDLNSFKIQRSMKYND